MMRRILEALRGAFWGSQNSKNRCCYFSSNNSVWQSGLNSTSAEGIDLWQKAKESLFEPYTTCVTPMWGWPQKRTRLAAQRPQSHTTAAALRALVFALQCWTDQQPSRLVSCLWRLQPRKTYHTHSLDLERCIPERPPRLWRQQLQCLLKA